MPISVFALLLPAAMANPADCPPHQSFLSRVLKTVCAPVTGLLPKACGETTEQKSGVRFVGEINLREVADRKGLSGLSGLNYDEATNTFFAVSDSGYAEIVRFRLDVTKKPPTFERLPSIRLEGRSGYNDAAYIPPTTPGYIPTYDDIEDLEALTRKKDGTFLLLRESSRGATPGILHYSAEGKYLGQVQPAHLTSTEGLSLTPSNKQLWQSSEGGLQIGDQRYADVHHFSACEGKGFCRDKVVLFPQTNEVSEISALDETRMLTLERHWDGKMVHAKIGVVDTAGASDIGLDKDDWKKRSGVTLPDDFKLAERRELVDLNKLDGFKRVDNLEGMTLGPRLGEGKRSLVLVSDDNGNDKQINQLVILEVPDQALAPNQKGNGR